MKQNAFLLIIADNNDNKMDVLQPFRLHKNRLIKAYKNIFIFIKINELLFVYT